MRRPEIFCSDKSDDMTSPDQSPEIGGESRIDKVMKILSSPLIRKKSTSSSKTFGIPLEELVRRSPESIAIPVILKRLCEYIENNGIQHEGIFRINGNSRTLHKLRIAFDKFGDANLEEIGDVMAAAALLKQFLRELPEAVVPEQLHWQFVNAEQDNMHDNEECIRQMKQLVEQLPEESFNTLRYLMAFLTKVANYEDHNRMGPTALGIIFGPNLFRVSDDIQGLGEQAVTNQIVTRFIVSYSSIFEADSDPSETKSDPPKTQESIPNQISSEMDEYFNINIDGPSPEEIKDSDSSQPSSPSQKDLSSTDIEDSSDQVSATSLDSDDSETSSPTSSPAVSSVATNFVEMTISKSVNEHLFGGSSLQKTEENNINGNGFSNWNSFAIESHNKFNVNDNNIFLNNINNNNNEDNFYKETGVHAAPEQLDVRSPDTASQHIKDSKSDGSTIDYSSDNSFLQCNDSVDELVSVTPDFKHHDWGFPLDEEAHEVRRSVERLQQFQRPSPTKNRRSRKSVRKSHSLDAIKGGKCIDEDSLKENVDQFKHDSNFKNPHKMGYRKSYSFQHSHQYDQTSLDSDTSADRPSHPFLELHFQTQPHEPTAEPPQSPSPNTSRKPYIPPLDLTILHEHGDGNEPIPTNQLRASWPLSQMGKHDDDVMLSPRTSHLKKKTSVNLDPNIPPSPPVEQEAFVKITMKEDEANAATVKQLTKRIYALKKKIKQFEEGFEEEYGYRPSHSEKVARSDIKKYVSEMNKARKELKQLKEDTMHSNMSAGVSGRNVCSPSNCQCNEDSFRLDDEKSSMGESLHEMMTQLAEKRHVANRPENLAEMNREQVREEKIALQKSLLQFESIFGRPTTKSEKELMRPIYDRYRNVKRMINKLSSPKSKDQGTELQPILEHEAMDFTQASPQHQPGSGEEESVEIDEAYFDKENSQGIPDSKKVKKSHNSWPGSNTNSCNLHELTLPELLDQQRKVKEEKKRLRLVLREFEEEFQRRTGCRVQREDRAPLEAVYGEYKQIKAKLRLLEALLSKHDHHYTI